MKYNRIYALTIACLSTLALTAGAVFAEYYVQDNAGEVKVPIQMAALYHTVSFNTDGGSSVVSQNIEHGQKATRPESNPTKEGYVFVDWYTASDYLTLFDFENTTITADTTIYAKFAVDYDYGAQVGYYLVGNFGDDSNQYFKFSTAKESNLSAAGNLAVFNYALEEGDKFKVIHYNTENTASGATWYGYNDLQADFNTGYCYSFFEEDGDHNFVLKEGYSGNYRIYLNESGKIWINRYYTVTYKDGENNIGSQTVEGNTATTPIENPTKSGHVFDHWCSNIELTSEFDFSTLIISDTTLYASWVEGDYVVTFHIDNATAPSAQAILDGGKAIRPTDPTRDGYRFVNWYTEDTFENIFDFNTEIHSNLDLYGKWVQTYTVTFIDAVDSSTIDTTAVDTGTAVTRPVDPTHENYAFVNWYSDSECTEEYDFSTIITRDTNIYAKFAYDYNYGATGYRLIGAFGDDENAYYTFTNSIADTKEEGSQNTAEFLSVNLAAGQEVAVKNFNNGSEYGYNHVDVKNFASEGTSGRIKILLDGTYNFYFKESESIIYMRSSTLGAYMVGEGGTSMTDWTIKTGIASSTPTGTNIAEFLNVNLVEGQKFRIVNPSNGLWANKNEITNPLFEYEGDNIKVKLSGNYSIYLNGSNDVSIVTNSVENKTFTASWTENWVFSDNAVVFVYALGGVNEGAWYSCTKVSDTSITFTVPGDITKFLVVRCVQGTTEPNWDVEGDNVGRIYNQTNDINVTLGTLSYSTGSWKDYSKS